MAFSVTARVTVKVDTTVIYSLVDLPEVQKDIDRRANNCLQRQRALVPVDTGELRSTLQVRDASAHSGRLIGSFGCKYAASVELGWQHPISRRWIPGQPYLRPSIDAATH